MHSRRTRPCWLNRKTRNHTATPSSWRRIDGVEPRRDNLIYAPRVTSSHILKGRPELVVELQATEVHAAAVERPDRALRDVGIRRVPGVGERAYVEIKFRGESPDSLVDFHTARDNHHKYHKY